MNSGPGLVVNGFLLVNRTVGRGLWKLQWCMVVRQIAAPELAPEQGYPCALQPLIRYHTASMVEGADMAGSRMMDDLPAVPGRGQLPRDAA